MPSDAVDGGDIFSCRRCGECCRGYGGTYLSAAEVVRIADYLGISAERLLSGYCRYSGGRPLLRQSADGYCIFWRRLCTIHPVKPRMCRAWPFIESILVDPANWRAMASMCPGMRTDLSDAQIRARVSDQLAREPKEGVMGCAIDPAPAAEKPDFRTRR